MSVHNEEDFLEESITSILNQSFTEFEFIILEDGSTDSSSKIIDTYDDRRIMKMRNERNLGLTASLNKMVGTARGEYFCRHDGDDISLPTRLEEMNDFLK